MRILIRFWTGQEDSPTLSTPIEVSVVEFEFVKVEVLDIFEFVEIFLMVLD
jgi:hypothetical protein